MHSPDKVPVSVVHSPDTAPVSVANPPDPVSASTSHLSVSDVSHLTLIEDVDESITICTQPCSVHAGQGGAVTTKYGRHVRPPKRLMSCLNQDVKKVYVASSTGL